jgi:hypothetical protein
MPATKTCDKCSGDGTVLRPAEDIRKLDNGTLDPTDIRRREVCAKCGGSGVIPENYASVPDKATGFIADKI